MKVLVHGNELFSTDMLWGFVQAGCEATISIATNAGQMEQALEKADADLLITLGAPLELKPDIMAFLGNRRPSGVKHIHWDTDGISSTYYRSNSGDGIEMDVIYAAKPDLVLTICPEMRDFIIQRGFACEMMHYAYSPAYHRPMSIQTVPDSRISLIASSCANVYRFYPEHYRYTSLKILLKPLLEQHYPVHLYGDSGFLPLIRELLGVDFPRENYHGYLPYAHTCAIYNTSFMNMVTQNHNRTITKRTFEILGSGGFVLSSDNSEIRTLFTPGRDLVVSSSPEQTMELVQYYQKHSDEWIDIRKNAVQSVQNHTYRQRAEFIIRQYQKLIDSGNENGVQN